MASSKFLQLLRSVTLRMVSRAAAYPLQAGYHIARSQRPDLRGPGLWREAQKMANKIPVEPVQPPPDAFEFLGAVTGFEHSKDGAIHARAENGAVRILPLADDLVQIRVRGDGRFDTPFSYSVAKGETEWRPPAAKVTDVKHSILVKMAGIQVEVEKSPCRLRVLDGQGRPLFAETEGAGQHTGGDFKVWRAGFDPDAALYGLGEKAFPINLAGRRLELWNHDPAIYAPGADPLYMSIPFFIALAEGRAVGVFFDISHRTWIDLGGGARGQVELRTRGSEMRLYVMAGTPRQVIARYSELTGRTRMPPLWALGFHQSRWSYFQDRVLELAHDFRQRQIPCDAIHLDIHYMDDYRCFTWGRKHFPDHEGMILTVKQAGFKLIAIIDPGIKIDPDYWVYQEGVTGDRFLKYPDGERFTGPVWPGDCHFPDFTDPRVREWWGGLYAGLLDDGIDAFWNDMNEPALITRKRGVTIPEVVRHSWEGRGSTHAEAHNAYGVQMARASVEGIARLRPDRRALILTRSGWAGIQRYAMHWTGDNQSTWEHLKLSIQMVLSLGLSGVPITGPDIGGFGGGPSPELFARWIQVGALLPFCRVHSMQGSPDQEPWAFGPEVEAIAREYLGLRYRLLPYLYTAVWQAAQTGAPVVRPLFFEYPDDPQTYSLDDQFMLGDSLMVAPVVEEGATERVVYMPAGEWFDYWTHERIGGGQTITVRAPLDRLPLFMRAGAVIPLWPLQQHVGEKAIDTLTLQAFWADGEHHSVLYEDDGIRPDYERPEAHLVSRLSMDGKAGELRRVVEAGRFKPPYGRVQVHFVGLDEAPKDIKIMGGKLVSQSEVEKAGEVMVEAEVGTEFSIRVG